MHHVLLPDIRWKPCLQQPEWDEGDSSLVEKVRAALEASPPLAQFHDLRTLRSLLAQVADGEAQIVQAGDCAEDPAESSLGYVSRKAAVLDLLAGAMKMITHRPVLRIGRIGGQYGKPRSNNYETVGGVELPVFRGHMVNSPEPDAEGRRPDPKRLIAGYRAAQDVFSHLGWLDGDRSPIDPQVWTSHEALLMDYELPMVRRDSEGNLALTSTHLPWIGERTRQLDGAHVALLAKVVNPVGCKVGPKMSVPELLGLCERLDPQREKGRLLLISRMGAKNAAERLPELVKAVRAAGHPVIWLCDPMHGNTVTTPEGLKTRYLETVEQEVQDFQAAVTSQGGVAGGLHLETTPDDVTECVANGSFADRVGDKYTSCCDPRLNPWQAVSVVSAWRG